MVIKQLDNTHRQSTTAMYVVTACPGGVQSRGHEVRRALHRPASGVATLPSDAFKLLNNHVSSLEKNVL